MTGTLAWCSICHRRCLQRPDGWCGYCRQAVAKGRRDDDGEPWDDLELTGGEWVRDGLVVRWQPRPPEPVPDEPYNPLSRKCRRCRRPMRRGKRHRVPETVWHASNGYCEACNKQVAKVEVGVK